MRTGAEIEQNKNKSLTTRAGPGRILSFPEVGRGAAPSGRPLRLRVTAAVEAGAVACLVSDDGPGLAPERLRKLAELLAGRPDAVEGRGLFLVRQLAAAWGGGVQLRSEPGQGFTATLFFRPGGGPPEAVA